MEVNVMDTELFELCKEVYKRTGWGAGTNDRPQYFFHNDEVEPTTDVFEPTNPHEPECEFAPLYTSDYLLEKLKELHKAPHHNSGQSNFVFTIEFGSTGNFWLINCHEGIAASRPLKSFQKSNRTLVNAVLELVIALDDTGELK
ncbi:hypothetical protein HAV21_03405 [Paenarthrobacter sp. MSM-2-10-13]|uniref:hypothetical protein n=1 Tax=Paenarthrobacter sp. MSM-2-10-13 TaxID=2717318 RepID=UPI00141E7AB1|nr:hypothetical protein [Paenarthrobacter sp. MSM-2-10-13]NHW45944.1 hypothetical protein [Paenarthrobacter sp. MSM-2-10-13]